MSVLSFFSLDETYLSLSLLFVDTDTDPPVQVWKEMLVMVDNPFPSLGSEEKVDQIPRILIAISGEKDVRKQELANRVFCCWQVRLKKVKYGPKDCPFYQPSCQNAELRTFIGRLKSRYNFQFVLGDFNHFPGSLGSVLKALYAKRLDEWVSE